MTKFEKAKLYTEGFSSFVMGIGEEENPYPADGVAYHCWWDGWVDAAEDVTKYYKEARQLCKETEG